MAGLGPARPGAAWRGAARHEQGEEHGPPEYLRRQSNTEESTHGT